MPELSEHSSLFDEQKVGAANMLYSCIPISYSFHTPIYGTPITTNIGTEPTFGGSHVHTHHKKCPSRARTRSATAGKRWTVTAEAWHGHLQRSPGNRGYQSCLSRAITHPP